jgi:hypothetical protein
MLNDFPELLRLPTTVIDYSGRTIQNATVFEAALGAGDAAMAQMIRPYFSNLEDGDALRAAQYAQQFPNGVEQEADYDFAGLVQVISSSSPEDVVAQLHHQNRDSDLCAAMTGPEGFRARFKPGIVITGHHFNAQNLIRAFEVYAEQYDGWRDEQQYLFWRQVIGFIQRLLPAVDAQAFAQGLYYIVEKKEKPRRSFEFSHDKGVNILPLPDPRGGSGLGFDCAVHAGGPSPWAFLFRNFTEQKHQIIRSFTGPSQHHESGSCVMG